MRTKHPLTALPLLACFALPSAAASDGSKVAESKDLAKVEVSCVADKLQFH